MCAGIFCPVTSATHCHAGNVLNGEGEVRGQNNGEIYTNLPKDEYTEELFSLTHPL